MSRFLLYILLSILIHVACLATFAGMQFLDVKKEPKKNKILYVHQVKRSQLKKVEQKSTSQNKPVEKKVEKPKLANKPKVEQAVKQHPTTPSPTPTPYQISKKIYIKKQEPKAVESKEIKEEKVKLVTLKKLPYLKNWSKERLKAIPLPPGLKDWSETEKVLKELNKLNMLPGIGMELGNGNNSPVPKSSSSLTSSTPATPIASLEPTPEPTVIPTPVPIPTPSNFMNWKEYKDEKNKDIYQLKFYDNKIGYILTINKTTMKIEIKYFDFSVPENTPEDQIEVKIPENMTEEKIKTFQLPLTKEDLEAEKNEKTNRDAKDSLVRDTIRQKKITEGN